MIVQRWGYFLNPQQLVDIFKARGGKVGTFNPENPDDIHHARRAIFTYLQPGPVLVLSATLDKEVGIMFFVGKPVPVPREALDTGLASRCKKTFDRSPNYCRLVDHGSGRNWLLTAYDATSSIHQLYLKELLQSDREGDRHPLSPEEAALIKQPTTFTLLPPVQPRISLPKIYHRWGYLLDDEQLLDIFTSRGGTLDNVDPRGIDDINRARRAISLYLQPGHVQVWFAEVGEELDIVFFIGKPLPNLRESMDEGLERRCIDMFGRSPDPCRIVKGTSSKHWDLTDCDGTVHRFRLSGRLQCDIKGDILPVSKDEITVLHAPTSSMSSTSTQSSPRSC